MAVQNAQSKGWLKIQLHVLFILKLEKHCGRGDGKGGKIRNRR